MLPGGLGRSRLVPMLHIGPGLRQPQGVGGDRGVGCVRKEPQRVHPGGTNCGTGQGNENKPGFPRGKNKLLISPLALRKFLEYWV